MADIPALIAELRGFAEGSTSARASLMRDAADALEATLPKPGAKYREVRAGDDDPQPGELVRSKWSSAGAVWRIEKVEQVAVLGRRRPYLHMVSLSSGRRDMRHGSNLTIVVAVDA